MPSGDTFLYKTINEWKAQVGATAQKGSIHYVITRAVWNKTEQVYYVYGKQK